MLPTHQQPAVDQDGRFALSWRRWLEQLERRIAAGDTATLAADIAAIARALGSPDGSVAGIPAQNWLTPFAITSPDGSVAISGSPADGEVQLRATGGSDATGLSAVMARVSMRA